MSPAKQDVFRAAKQRLAASRAARLTPSERLVLAGSFLESGRRLLFAGMAARGFSKREALSVWRGGISGRKPRSPIA